MGVVLKKKTQNKKPDNLTPVIPAAKKFAIHFGNSADDVFPLVTNNMVQVITTFPRFVYVKFELHQRDLVYSMRIRKFACI